MTATASDDLPEAWSQWDDIAVEAFSHFETIDRLADFNAHIFFADRILSDETINITDEDTVTLHNYIDEAIEVEAILTKHLSPNYITEYLDTIETEDTDE